MRAAFPTSYPLLPARTRSLRSVSGILTSPPQQDKRARSGSLRLHFAQTKGGEQFGIDWGETRNPPGPGKTRPGSRFPPRPPFLPPRKATVVPAVLMTVEGGWTTVPAVTRPAETASTAGPPGFRRAGNPGKRSGESHCPRPAASPSLREGTASIPVSATPQRIGRLPVRHGVWRAIRICPV